jgi:hypothetical protein
MVVGWVKRIAGVGQEIFIDATASADDAGAVKRKR